MQCPGTKLSVGMNNCSVELNGDSVLFGYITNDTTWRLESTPAQRLRDKGYQIEDKTAGGLRTYDLVRGYLQPFPEAWSALYPSGAQPAFWNLPHDSRIIVIQTGINDFKDPFNFGGQPLYYDPKEGKYLDPKTDWYLTDEEFNARQ